MNSFLRKLLSRPDITPPNNADGKKRRKLVAKRHKLPCGAIRLNANTPILEQLRQWR